MDKSKLIKDLDDLNDLADGVLAVPGKLTEEDKIATAEAIKNIMENQEKAAEVFNPAAALVIPYEKNTKKTLISVIKIYLEHDVEMPYSRSNVESGVYRAWIEQVSSEHLRKWRDLNMKHISVCFSRRFVPPEWQQIQTFRVRWLIYEVELVRRAGDWTIEKKLEMFESFDLALTDLRVRYAEFIKQFMYDDTHPMDESDDPDKGLPY